MTQDKKKNFIRRLTIGIGVILAIIILAVSMRDLFLSPNELMKYGMEKMRTEQFKAAERYLILASNTDDKTVSPLASFELGELYRKGKKTFPANGQKAALFLEKASVGGIPMAAYRLALMYDNGDQIVENRSKALFFMNQAAKAGIPDALYALGVWLERGYMGAVDMNKVVALYEQAAQQGHRNAITSLVAIYAGGFGHFPENIERSVYWQEKLNINNTIPLTTSVSQSEKGN